MKLEPTTPLNDSIKRMSQGNASAASVLALLNKERPQSVVAYMRALDGLSMYGSSISDMFFKKCGGDMVRFVSELTELSENGKM